MRTLLIFLTISALAAAITGLAIGFNKNIAADLRLPLMAATAVPFLLILVLAYAGAWARAAALALGSAVVAFCSLILFAGIFTLFLGFTMGNTDQLAFILLLDVFVVLQIPLGIAAWRVYRKAPAMPAAGRVWALAWGLPLVLAAGIAAGITGFDEHHKQRVNDIYRNEDAARQALDRIVACLKPHAGSTAGFPATLSVLGPSGTQCLESRFLEVPAAGHQLSYAAGPPDAQGVVRLYSLCARARDFRKSAWRTYVVDESGTMRMREPHEQMQQAFSCAQAWANEPLRRVKHCLVELAAKQGSYPSSLDAVAASGSGCLAPSMQENLRVSAGVMRSGEVSVTYQPGEPNQQGKITTFRLHGQGDAGRWRVQLMLDETGRVFAAQGREATPDDPAPEAFAQMLDTRETREKNRREEEWLLCDGGDAEICTRLGLAVIDGDQWHAADRYWRRGCELGSAKSCVLATRETEFSIFLIARDDQRECGQGQAEACRRLDRLAGDFRECRQSKSEGCHGVARRLARSGETHKANGYWDRGCKTGHAESCYFLRIRDFDYIRALKLAEGCDAGSAPHCAELRERVGASAEKPAGKIAGK